MVQPPFCFGDLRRPQTPAPGFTPAQTRAKGQSPHGLCFRCAGLLAAPPFHQWKGFEFILANFAIHPIPESRFDTTPLAWRAV